MEETKETLRSTCGFEREVCRRDYVPYKTPLVPQALHFPVKQNPQSSRPRPFEASNPPEPSLFLAQHFPSRFLLHREIGQYTNSKQGSDLGIEGNRILCHVSPRGVSLTNCETSSVDLASCQSSGLHSCVLHCMLSRLP